MNWADIVREFHHDDVVAWADVVDNEEGRTWADIVREACHSETSETTSDSATHTSDAIPGDPVGIRAIQSILMSATQMSLSHFHTAGMDTVSNKLRLVPSAADAMNSVYTVRNTSMTFESSDDVYELRRQIVGADLGSFVSTVGSSLTGLPDRENVWYEAMGKEMFEGILLRMYVDYDKLLDHGLTLEDLARECFGNDVVTNVSPDFMGMLDIEVPDDYLSQWLGKMSAKVCGTFNIRSCEKISDTVITKGTDVLAVSRVPNVNKKTITSNNVAEVEANYGIEAAAFVLEQLTGSHIVSDFMARTGKVLSFMKNSVEVQNKGLLTSMGFERPKEDIKRRIMARAATTEHGTSVYESIITGTDPACSFQLIQESLI